MNRLRRALYLLVASVTLTILGLAVRALFAMGALDDPQDLAALQAHLGTCGDCRRELEALRADKDTGSALERERDIGLQRLL